MSTGSGSGEVFAFDDAAAVAIAGCAFVGVSPFGAVSAAAGGQARPVQRRHVQLPVRNALA